MFAILKKELWSYFGNWTAWLIIAAFSTVATLFLFFFNNNFNIFEIGTASLQSYFTLAPWLLIFLMPALAMKTFAEEQQQGTLLWLFSQPVKISSLVLGKFLSVFFIGLLCILPSVFYFSTVYILGLPAGNIDFGATIGSYFGLVLLIAAFASVGIIASSFASNQIVAYLAGVFLSFLLYFGVEQLASYQLLGRADYVLQNLGFYHHFSKFTRGQIDSQDVFYFLLVMMMALVLSVLFIEKKKQ